MKHVKLFEDFRKAETRYALNNEVRKYAPIKTLPKDGNAFINDQFEALIWINSLEKSGYKPMNRIESFKEVGFIAWSSSQSEMTYAMRSPHGIDEPEDKYICKFRDYFELIHEFRGHNLKKFGV
jgi:hypothetical protein